MNESNLPADKKSDSSLAKKAATPASGPRVYTSAELFGDQREIWIEHGEAQYRLRITSSGKLVLNK